MPICAIIDQKVFCAHGGIPTSVTSLGALEAAIPSSPLPDPQIQSPPAHEILWNDPITKEDFQLHLQTFRSQGFNDSEGLARRGYLPNTKRGTGYSFSEFAVEAFLAENKLTHIIRAHECCPEGYQLHCAARVLTIFTCSHYCEMRNKAAVALVDAIGRICILQIDTRSNYQ